MAEIDASELTAWSVYFDQEPPADIKADIRWSHWMALYANAHRGADAGQYEPKDFLDALPWWNRPDDDAEPDIEALREKMTRVAAAFRG